jgi:hypothetical protein
MSNRSRFLKEFPRALADDVAAIFVGAGVSIGAGYPSWKDLLHEIGEELGVRTSDVLDLAALAQWSIRKSAGKTQILQLIRDKIGAEKPVPEPLEIIARLPMRNLWTTNYDRLIERSFEMIGRPIDVISTANDLSIRPRSGASRLFKMHGSVDRLDDIVIATDDYELYRRQRGSFLPLLQAHMTSLAMLFVGLSFTDPNVKHVLSMIRESFAANPPEHFAIVKPPHENDYDTADEYKARLVQHDLWSDDLLRYGLKVVEIEDYAEVPKLLRSLERCIAINRVWVSGSWPVEGTDSGQTAYVYEIAEKVGRALADGGFDLVTGAGLTVGSASVAGFLQGLQRAGGWNLERRLIARPFPQPLQGQEPDQAQWSALRKEVARLSGTIIFIGGLKFVDDVSLESADGVVAEMEVGKSVGSFLLPIGSTGGAALDIVKLLKGSAIPAHGPEAQRPEDEELDALVSQEDPNSAVKVVMEVLKRVQKER